MRLFVLQAHYRKPLDFTAEALEAASTGWKGLNAAIGLGDRHGKSLGWRGVSPLADGAATHQGSPRGEELQGLEQRFINAMDDDLNSSGALAVLFIWPSRSELWPTDWIVAMRQNYQPKRWTSSPADGTCYATSLQ